MIPWGAKSFVDASKLIPADVGAGVVGFASSSCSGWGFISLSAVGGASGGASNLLPRLLCWKDKKNFKDSFFNKNWFHAI